VDLEAYFDRIGYDGPRRADRATLDALCLAHVKAIPFENLDVLLDRGVSLDDDAVDDKLVRARRGGYCFEHNTLMARVLAALGFEVKLLSGRVRISRPADFVPPRTHVFCRVEIGGESFLADVGVGGLSPTASLRLVADVVQQTPHEPRRLLREPARWLHQVKLGDAWADVCELTLEEMPRIDREVANWYTSTHPASHFRGRLMVARALDEGGRVTLLDRTLTVRGRGGEETREIASRAELLDVLAERFGLELPAGTVFDTPGLAGLAPAP
jgi:N-hydroxyarylamine O-acetyltransferase